ncbi:hypothetical protein BH10ACT1_BH10ACT1_05930 [soil metagenome]
MSEPHSSDQDAEPSIKQIEPRTYARMLSFLRESVLVADANWAIRANLSAPAGLLGWGDPTGMHLLAYMHPDDVLRLADTGTGLRQTDPGWSGSAVVRLRRSDETYGHYEITVHNCTDDPILQGMVICTREVAPPARSAPELEPTGMVASLADQLPNGVVLVSGSGYPLYVNDAACDLLDTTQDQFIASGLHQLVEEVDRLEVGAILNRLRRSTGRETRTVSTRSVPPRRLEVTFASRTGSAITTDGSDEILLVLVLIEDVTHRLEREEELEHRANRDALTGLHNRAWLLDHLYAQLTAGADVTVAYVDLVGFKSVNDRLGHPAGDLVLAAVAQSIATEADPGVAVARVGGDEFVVVLDGGTDDERAHLADRIRAAVAGAPAAIEAGVTASVGVIRSVNGDQPWDLLARADAAMYVDKRGEQPPT